MPPALIFFRSSQSFSYDNEQEVDVPHVIDCDYIDRGDKPFLVFKFRCYSRRAVPKLRSENVLIHEIEGLQSLGLIPPPPPPPRLEERIEEELTREEMVQLIKQQKAC